MKALIEGGEVIEALRERILGRVCVEDVIEPRNGGDRDRRRARLLDEDAVT
jgi:DNA-directed RNA polymerase subunit beta'